MNFLGVASLRKIIEKVIIKPKKFPFSFMKESSSLPSVDGGASTKKIGEPKWN